MPNGKPNSQCSECKGKGVITLFTSAKPCDCVDRIEWMRQEKYDLDTDQFYRDYVDIPSVSKYDFSIDPEMLEKLKKIFPS